MQQYVPATQGDAANAMHAGVTYLQPCERSNVGQQVVLSEALTSIARLYNEY